MTNKELRTAMGVLEKRVYELKLALELAQRGRALEKRVYELKLALELARRGRVEELGAQNAGLLCTQCAMAASFMAGGSGDGGVA